LWLFVVLIDATGRPGGASGASIAKPKAWDKSAIQKVAVCWWHLKNNKNFWRQVTARRDHGAVLAFVLAG
jgi:hypothetical protein